MQKQNPGKKKYRKVETPAAEPRAVVAIDDTAPPEMLTAGVLIPMFMLVTVLGYVVFRRNIATTSADPMSIPASVFSAVNLSTCTGFQQPRNPSSYTAWGQLTAMALMWAGALFSLIGGGLAVKRIARLRMSDGRFALTAVAGMAGAVAVGFVAVAVTTGTIAVTGGTWMFPSLFLATSAVANCGLAVGATPSPIDVSTHLVLMPLSLIGGLGLPVVIELVALMAGGTVPSRHTRTALSATAVVTIAAVIGLMALEQVAGQVSWSHWRQPLGNAAAQAINGRGAGFEFDSESVSRMPQSMGLGLIVLMLIGGCPAGTAGGIKVTTLAVVGGGVRDALRGRSVGRPFGLAVVWVGIYVAGLTILTTILLITEPQYHLDRTLFLAAATIGNIGLSHNPIDLSDTGLFVLSAGMLAGKIGPPLMLWHIAQTARAAEVATA